MQMVEEAHQLTTAHRKNSSSLAEEEVLEN
jgi:hypothetical protein